MQLKAEVRRLSASDRWQSMRAAQELGHLKREILGRTVAMPSRRCASSPTVPTKPEEILNAFVIGTANATPIGMLSAVSSDALPVDHVRKCVEWPKQ
jgi:hypothetical protein